MYNASYNIAPFFCIMTNVFFFFFFFCLFFFGVAAYSLFLTNTLLFVVS